MSSLNILCAVCSEYFQNSDVIFSTRCGHVFHKSCLFRWLQSSSNCPQCRRYTSRHLCHQLYVDFVEKTSEDDAMSVEFPKTFHWIYSDQDVDFTDDMSFAFMFGWDEDGCDIYAARAWLNGALVPGYYIPTKGEVVVSWESQSHNLMDDYEILDISNDTDAEYKWVPASNGHIPSNAFPTGKTVEGEILFTARTKHNGKIFYGKLLQHCFQAHVPYEDKEISNAEYEVLVRTCREVDTTPPISGSELKENMKSHIQ